MTAALRRILVVDDEPAVAGTLRDYLISEGYDADVALNGRDGLALFERKRPDVLLDIAMPGMDGVEVLRRLKAIDATIPVILVTANADETQARETLKTGAFDYVTKPFQLDRLSAEARRAVPREDLRKRCCRAPDEQDHDGHADEDAADP